ncbi:MAG: hypothetical protein C0412_13435 [Flavobacterium sp.]|nr:hypothetical protein [Flavobacterium sp.]
MAKYIHTLKLDSCSKIGAAANGAFNKCSEIICNDSFVNKEKRTNFQLEQICPRLQSWAMILILLSSFKCGRKISIIMYPTTFVLDDKKTG